MAQIEVTEETIRDQADASTFALGALLAGQVSGLSATGMLVAAVVDGIRVTARMPISGIDGGGPGGGLDGTCECPDPAPCAHVMNLIEARDDAGLSVPVMTGLLERLDELYLEARQLAGPKS